MTLAVNGWHPKQSNEVLEKTCLKESQAFYTNYLALKRGNQVKQGKEVLKTTKLKVSGETAQVAAYFVTLPQAVRFNGVTKCEF